MFEKMRACQLSSIATVGRTAWKIPMALAVQPMAQHACMMRTAVLAPGKSREKFELLGKKPKKGSGKFARENSSANEKRKDTLSVELSQSRRANTFVDRRIGEDDNDLTPEDRAVARFQRQRVKDFEGSRSFKLPREDDDQLFVGKLGRSESEGSGSEPERTRSDEQRDSPEDLPASGQTTDVRRSKKEIMEEVVAKSKAHRAEKAKLREADMSATERLDAELASLLQNGVLPGRSGGVAKHAGASLDPSEEAFDRDRRVLATQARAKGGEATRTGVVHESVALHGTRVGGAARKPPLADTADAEEDAVLPQGGYALRRAKRARAGKMPSEGDSDEEDEGNLQSESDDAGADESPKRLKLGLDERRAQRAAGSHPLQESFRKTTALLLGKFSSINKDAQGATDEKEGVGHSSSSESEDEIRVSVRTSVNLPGVITDGEIPETYDEYMGRTPGVASALNTCLTLMRPGQGSAAARPKLQVLFGHLVQHFADTASQTQPNTDVLDVLMRHILSITPSVPLFAARTALARLTRLQDRLVATLTPPETATGLNRGWPPRRQLYLLKLWATIFPATRRRHPVMTPLAVLVASYLALCPVESGDDVRAGLFLSAVGLQLAADAEWHMPECLAFATKVVSIMGRDSQRSTASTFQALTAASHGVAQGDHDELITAAVSVLEQASAAHSNTQSYPELFAPTQEVLRSVCTAGSLPKNVGAAVASLQRSIASRAEAIGRQRIPLRKVKKLKEIRQFNPRFEEEFVAGRDNDPDREKASARKLKRQLTKERRGAMRELRKDARFLADEARRESDAGRSERKQVVRKNTAWLQQMEADFKSGGQGGLWKRKTKK